MLRVTARLGRASSLVLNSHSRSRLPSSMAVRIASSSGGGDTGGSGRHILVNNPLVRVQKQTAAPFATEVSRKVNEDEEVHEQKGGGRKGMSWVQRIFHPNAAEAESPDFNRWTVIAPAFLAHMCIGSPYAWSVMSDPISKTLGVVASSPTDWSLFECTLPLSLVFAFQGLAAAFLGSWAMRAGPRASMTVSSLCFGGGLMLGGLGVHLHSLPLLYASYGVMGGAGVGLAYTPPIHTVISWFPDKRGLASGLTIAGFGSGALVFTSLANQLMAYFSKAPMYLTGDVVTKVVDGKLLASLGEGTIEVVRATAAELAPLPFEGLSEGLYVVGTGSTGAAESLAVCGAIYSTVILGSAFAIRTPPPGYRPAGWEPPIPKALNGDDPGEVDEPEQKSVTANNVLRTPQFYLLGTTFVCIASGGIGLMSVAKPMLGEIFSSVLPAVVTGAFTSQYIQVLAVGNLGGRIGWAALSDAIGRRPVFNIFVIGSALLYLSMPHVVHQVAETGSTLMLYSFMGATAACISIMGGTYALLPAYESDLFGSKYVGPIHGRILLFGSIAALAGPSAIHKLRSSSESVAIQGLLTEVDADAFETAFHAPISRVDELIQSKAVSIPRLVELAPPGTIDPSPFVYDSTMYAMAGLMAVSAVAHAFVRPVHPKYFERLSDANVIDVTPSSSTKSTAHELRPLMGKDR